MGPKEPDYTLLGSDLVEIQGLAIRSVTLSESMLSEPVPPRDAEVLTLPEWGDEKDAVQWFLQLRTTLKSISKGQSISRTCLRSMG